MNANPIAGIRGLWGQAEAGSRIFVSYRRDDARGDAGRLTDKLKAHFGEKQIFRDVEAIEAGVDFVEALTQAVSRCAVLLAVMGPNWLKISDAHGRRRLDDPNDFVRLEIAAALQRNIRVVPVLVGGAKMPAAEELPPGLESFARRQAHDLSDARWDFDVGQLVEMLEKAGIGPARRARPAPEAGPWKRHRLALGAGAVLLMMGGYLYSEFEDDLDELFTTPVATPPEPLLNFPPSKPPPAGREISRPSPAQSLPAANPPPAAPKSPIPAPSESPRRTLSYRGFDAIGRYPTVVQVFNPG